MKFSKETQAWIAFFQLLSIPVLIVAFFVLIGFAGAYVGQAIANMSLKTVVILCAICLYLGLQHDKREVKNETD